MDGVQFAGVKNNSGKEIKQRHGERWLEFAPDEIKVLDAETVQFLLGRSAIESDGKVVTRRMLFRAVPLTEALKHVKEPENKSIAAAKKAAEIKEKEKAEMRAEILASLKMEGLIQGLGKK